MVFKTILTKDDIKKIFLEFKCALERAGVNVECLILFGSYAKGKPQPWSDIDICVVSPQFGKRDFDDMAKLAMIGKRVNYLIESHPVNPRDLALNQHPLAEEIKKTGKQIYKKAA